MKVLVACEESQTICKAFRELGHEAYSADILDPTGGHPEWHIKGDVLKVLNPKRDEFFDFDAITFKTMDGRDHLINHWDLIIAHPPCTYLSSVNNRHMSLRINPPEKVEARTKLMHEAADFFMNFINADCDHIAVENPQGYMSRLYRKPDQTIHPYQFADSTNDIENYHMKRTCLWLKGLPLLETNDLPKPEPLKTYINIQGKVKRRYFEENHGVIAGQKHKGNDASARSKTFPGMAREMARQWSEYLINNKGDRE